MFRLAAVVLLVVSTVSVLSSTKIIGGETSIEEFPSQASFFIFESLICTASILSEKVVLTGGRCLLNKVFPENCTVRVGSALSDEEGQIISIKNFYRNPYYSESSYDYDIALLTLRTPIVFDGVTVAPIKFAQSGKPQQGGVVGLVAGWETGKGGHRALRKVSLTVAEHEQCAEVYADNDIKITKRMLCVLVDKENDICTRDRGSALIVDGVLVGIASWSKECGNPEYPSVFTDISILSDWILETLAHIG